MLADVGDPQCIGPIRREPPLDQVRRRRRRWVTYCASPPTAPVDTLQPAAAHQPGHPFTSTSDLGRQPELRMHPGCAVTASRHLMDRADLFQQGRIRHPPARAADHTIRGIRTSRHPTPDMRWPPGSDLPRGRQCPGRSSWEDVLPGEVGRSLAQDPVLDLHAPLLPAQRGQLLRSSLVKPLRRPSSRSAWASQLRTR